MRREPASAANDPQAKSWGHRLIRNQLESDLLFRKSLPLIAASAAVVVGGSLAISAVHASGKSVTGRLVAASSSLRGEDSGVLSIARVRAQVKAGTYVAPKAAGVGLTQPLLPSECTVRFGSPCYGATQLRHLYGLDKIPNVNRHGRTVALIMPGLDPVLGEDMAHYATQYSLPAPTLTVHKQGNPKVLDPNKPEEAVVGEELTLDAEAIQSIAPGANIVYVPTERDVAGTPESFKGALDTMEWLAAHGVDAVSLSYGWFELQYDEATDGHGAELIRSQRAGLIAAAKKYGMTVLSANGDTGPTGPNLAGTAVYAQQTAAFIASDPLTTAVGGTELHADDAGNRTSPDTVWGEHDGDMFATGGARSAVFSRPSYQDPVRGTVGAHRGSIDIAMDGSTKSRVWVYTSRYQVLSGQQPGWVRAAGTSAASPLFAGIVADAAQVAGHRLGPINPALYRLARTRSSRAAAGIADVTEGCNTITGVQGYCAKPGYDLASGNGTVGDASKFVPALAAATR